MDKKIRLCLITLCAGIVACHPNTDSDVSVPPEPENPAAQNAMPRRAHDYSLLWVDNNIPPTMSAGSSTQAHVRVKNTGDWTWPDAKTANPPKPDGSYAVRLTYRWASAEGALLPENQTRGELPANIPPGEMADFAIKIDAPKAAGQYQLQVDVVEELITFFSAKGMKKLIVPITVG
jgi:hypothetical protein